jgi:predicted GNAT superfamily acetyltransferase
VSYTFREIGIADMQLLADDLLTEHWQEVAKNKDLMVLAPDWSKYYDMEYAGKILVVGAFSGSVLVGYSVNITDTHLHYVGLYVCCNDIIYITPSLRTSPLGLRLMQETRVRAKRCGAKLMLWHAKEDSSLDKILRRRKAAKVQDIVFSEEL